MITSIQLRKVATYDSTAEELTCLAKINFIYGSNGTGKTTISRVIADSDAYSDCSVVWHGAEKIDTLVYNRDFVEKNFNQPAELKGIFTLGEKDKDTLDKIDIARAELDAIKAQIKQLRTTLDGENGNGGKSAELAQLELAFETKCWNLKLKHDQKLKGAFQGVRGDRKKFKARLLAESSSNSSIAIPLAELERKAKTVFGETPQVALRLSVPNVDDLMGHETARILDKTIIGKIDVDIASLVQRLGNSDWVKQGRNFYDPKERVCPFCQQETPPSLEDSLNEYFDETFEGDTAELEKLYADYRCDAERLQQSVQSLLANPSEFIDAEKIQSESDLLDSKIRINIQRIGEKRRELSKLIELESLKSVLDAIETRINTANSEIMTHNAVVSNLEKEKAELTGQVWRYLLDHEIKNELKVFNGNNANIKKAIQSLRTQIEDMPRKEQEKTREIRALERDTTSIQPTIDSINDLLQSFGFNGFSLAKSERDRFYKIQRPDGTDAKETLSEGEQSFIAFLYFYHLLKGSETESGMTSDRVVVFDDPVSSLDSDILFIVSNLIKGLFDEVKDGEGTVKQIFVLTHNVYFHKEVSFHPKRPANGRLQDETFWTVRKSKQNSKIQRHETNPIKTSYELLWAEVRRPDRDNLAIQNTMRRILENYYKILGNVDPDGICARFEGKEKLICQSLFSWVNDGSHSAYDSLYISIEDSMVESYLTVFREIFVKTKHMAHYEMMMGTGGSGEKSEPIGLVT